jgi:hypothetical protein
MSSQFGYFYCRRLQHNLMVCKLVFKHQHGYLQLRLQHNLLLKIRFSFRGLVSFRDFALLTVADSVLHTYLDSYSASSLKQYSLQESMCIVNSDTSSVISIIPKRVLISMTSNIILCFWLGSIGTRIRYIYSKRARYSLHKKCHFSQYFVLHLISYTIMWSF